MNVAKKGVLKYIISDYVMAAIAWMLFLYFRKNTINNPFENGTNFSVKDIIFIVILIPTCWIILHLFTGAYFNIYRKSRLMEIFRTSISCIIGALLIFFIAVINDQSLQLNYYLNAFMAYYGIQLLCTLIGRILVLNSTKKHFIDGTYNFKTLMVGGDAEAEKLYLEVTAKKTMQGNVFAGFVYATEDGSNGLSKYLPKLGSIENLSEIIATNNISEVIIAIDTNHHHKLQNIITQLSHHPVVIKIIPDMYDIISGSVKSSNVLGEVLIEIYPELMPDWQRVIKRALDILISLFVLIIFSPLYVYIAIRVLISSKGEIFYKQQRIGLYGKPFYIYKFRSMYKNSEDKGPALSSENDSRITKWGKTMRKWRFDELPQFYNVLIGNMSLVGPRPERKHYIDIISITHPHYTHLHRVKPGLSSWGMVKFGYAENVDQMKDRMKYDLMYLKNCSLALDTKIIFYTFVVLLQGRGK
jgi:polysaccharide biosynthesis protein PslA